jgi:hypothetical protein
MSAKKYENDNQLRQESDKQLQLAEKFKKEKRELLAIIKTLKNKLLSRILIPEGLTLQEEAECTELSVKDGENMLASCTLPYLLKYIIDLPTENTSKSHISYAYGLFLQHRLFTESNILLESLLLKFKSLNSNQASNQLER